MTGPATDPRASALPPLDSPWPLEPGHIEAFRRDGFVHLRGVCSAEEVAAYRPHIQRATRAANTESRPLAERDAFGRAFLQTMQIRYESPEVMAWCTSPRFGAIAARLLGVDAVRIYHDQSLFKEPGGATANGTPWHQDLYYWPFEVDTVCGMWIPLVDVTPAMGGLRYVRGSHRCGDVGARHISEDSDAHYARWIEAGGHEVVTPGPLRAGDALFHAGWAIHGADGNRSDAVREAMVVAYYADGMRASARGDRAREANRRAFLDDAPPGALAVGSRNERVYPRD